MKYDENIVVSDIFITDITARCTTRPDKHGRVVLIVKRDLLSVRYYTSVNFYKVEQKHKAMFNWSPCNIWRRQQGIPGRNVLSWNNY